MFGGPGDAEGHKSSPPFWEEGGGRLGLAVDCGTSADMEGEESGGPGDAADCISSPPFLGATEGEAEWRGERRRESGKDHVVDEDVFNLDEEVQTEDRFATVRPAPTTYPSTSRSEDIITSVFTIAKDGDSTRYVNRNRCLDEC